MKRKIWKMPTKADVKAFLDRWASQIDLVDEFRKLERQADYQQIFEPVLLPDGTLPEGERLSRGRDFEEGFKQVFGHTMEEDAIIQEALRLYEEGEDGDPSDLRVV